MSAKPVPPVSALAEPYWQGAAGGELRVQHCAACDARFLYARALCPRCWTPDPEWVAVSGRGTIATMTVVHQAPYAAFADDVPFVIAVIRLEEGPQLMANILGADPATLSIGHPVTVTFEQRGELFLPQFRPAELD